MVNKQIQGKYMTEYGYINENGYLVSRIMDDATAEQIAGLQQAGWKPVDLVDESRLVSSHEFYAVKIEPYDAGDRIRYRYPVVFNKKRLDKKIDEIKTALSASDYKVIKCYECAIVGESLPYNMTELRAHRQTLRNQINELEQLKS
jgi:hypothetical protein